MSEPTPSEGRYYAEAWVGFAVFAVWGSFNLFPFFFILVHFILLFYYFITLYYMIFYFTLSFIMLNHAGSE